MPYIKNDHSRRQYLSATSRADHQKAQDAGELNFQISELCADFIERKGLSYERINLVIGVLECAKLELYRRIAAPYEDTKAKENGDVYSESVLSRRPDDGHPSV